MAGKVMILGDSFSLRDEAVQYSIELAKRMDCSLILLVLLPLDSDEALSGPELESRAKKALEAPLKAAQEAGVVLEAEVRVGNLPSELMKVLAEVRAVKTIVWGGYEDLGNLKHTKPHWLFKLKDSLDLPVVAPVNRS